MKLVRVAASPLSLDVLLRGQLRFLSGFFEVVAVASPDRAVHQRIRRREGVRTVPLRIARRISPLTDLWSLVALWRLFRRERPEIVHSITPKAGLLSMIAARAAGVPIRVHTFTGLIFPWRRGFSRRVLLLADRLICFFATHVIPEGDGVRRDLVEHRVTNHPLRVLADGHVNGIDTEHFSPGARRPSRSVRFVFVGRLVRDKGVEDLRAAFEGLIARRRSARLTLVGDFEQRLDPLDAATVEWVKSGKGVKHAGFQQDIRPFLRTSDVLVLPSYREGFPGAPLEAGAMGLPVIVTDICGSREIVVDGITGLVVPPRDPDALLAAMRRLADNPELRREMGWNARTHVVEKWNRARVWNALLEFYNDVSKGL